ncbi:hypothetical protein DENSPDRAFT_193338 [Dentipellis sp. KUC8613]|nr:hypothetical protein DENSPDRAFT_193338 [Dentipellis sp. KUC8613]
MLRILLKDRTLVSFSLKLPMIVTPPHKSGNMDPMIAHLGCVMLYMCSAFFPFSSGYPVSTAFSICLFSTYQNTFRSTIFRRISGFRLPKRKCIPSDAVQWREM